MLNRGAIFIVGLRWLLLLLSALVVEKCLEGVIYGLTSTSDNTGQTIFATGISNPDYVFTGLALVVITLLFLSRYFLCAVEPIVAFYNEGKGREEAIDFTCNWQDKLKRVPVRWMAMVTLVVAGEFCILFFASQSIANWSVFKRFLLSLILFDTGVYFVIPGLIILVAYSLTVVGHLVTGVLYIIALISVTALIGVAAPVKFALKLFHISVPINLEKMYSWIEEVFDKIAKTIREKLKEIRDRVYLYLRGWLNKYILWNSLDLVIVIGGIYTAEHLESPVLIIVLCCVVLVESIANFYFNRKVYRNNIGLLARAQV